MSPLQNKSFARSVAGLCIASLALAGCSTAGTSQAGAGSKTVVVSMWASGEAETAGIEAQLEIARKQNPELTIELRTSPWADYFTKLTTDIASGNTACVAGMNSSMFPGYVAGFRELSDADLSAAGIMLEDFAPGAAELMSVGDTLYGLPQDISTMVVYTNEDILNAAKVKAPADGWTFEDFRETAIKATTDDKFGFSVGVSTSSWQAIPISISGTQPVNAAGDLDLTSPDFAAAATKYAELVTVDKVSPAFPSAAETNYAQDQYVAGNVGMVVDGSWNAVRYLENESGFKAGLATLPGNESSDSLGMALGSGYVVSKDCENPGAALKVLASMVSSETLDDVASSGRAFPARIASQPLFYDSLPEAHRSRVKATFDAAFENVQGQRITDNWTELGTYTVPHLVDVYSGRKTMGEMLEAAQSQFGK